jgi:signal transduction histidine kinase
LEKPDILPAAGELIGRIDWLIRLRWVAVVGVVCTVEVARRIVPAQLALREIYAVVAGIALYNSILHLVARRLQRLPAGRLIQRGHGLVHILTPRALWGIEPEAEALQAAVFANMQISIDLFALAVLLHFAGGIENPFIYFFIFHAIIAGILLSRRATYFQGALGLVLISAVAAGESLGVLKHYPLNGAWEADAYRDLTLVLAQVVPLAITLSIAIYMTSNIAAHLRNRERQIYALTKELSRKSELLGAAYERLSAVERAKSQYMRKVSHELRGPLGTIQTALKTVLQGIAGEVPQGPRDLIIRAERRAGELAQMTQDLLALSRAKEAALASEMSDIDPSHLLAEVVADMRTIAEERGVTIEADTAPLIGKMHADPAGLQQLVANLLSNAIRYSRRGGKVVVRLRKENGALRLQVEDTGIGIPKEDLDRVFEDFFRSSNAREHTAAGTGLGLAIVKAVIDQHRGHIIVESDVGKGTRFTVDLPLGADSS